jgi:hypothetical protein
VSSDHSKSVYSLLIVEAMTLKNRNDVYFSVLLGSGKLCKNKSANK